MAGLTTAIFLKTHRMKISGIWELWKTAGLILLMVLCEACHKENRKTKPLPEETPTRFISAADISFFPEIEQTHPVFYNLNNQPQDFLRILKDSGINTIRLRLWVSPASGHSGFEEVRQFSAQLQDLGFQIWLTVHYSDTWADPAHQKTPTQWQDLSYNELKDCVEQYTRKVVKHLQPHYIQIGNEINPGLLLPFGDRFSNPDQYLELLTVCAQAVRSTSPDTRIIMHYAGLEGSDAFYQQIENLDYDIIGLSYYPIWHGKSLDSLQNTLQQLSTRFKKDVLIAETAYPFTLQWNDWTHNIIGSEDQIILPDFPASPQGQKDYIAYVRKMITQNVSGGLGFCYWGAGWIAWKGNEATDGSSWENQALFDFNNRALPVLQEFAVD